MIAKLVVTSGRCPVFFRVKARDADASGSPNSDLTYSIYERDDSGIQKVFKVDAASGVIRLKRSIARLENQVYQFFVRATDAGSGRPLHSDVPVEVRSYSRLFFITLSWRIKSGKSSGRLRCF